MLRAPSKRVDSHSLLSRGARAHSVLGAILLFTGCFFSLPDQADPKAAADAASEGGNGRAYADEVLADAPLAYWRFDETSGSTVVDATGKTTPGNLQGTPKLGEPGLGAGSRYSIRFDGKSGVATPLVIPDDAFTLEAIVQPASFPRYESGIFCSETFKVNGFRMGVINNAIFRFWTDESGGAGNVQTNDRTAALGVKVHVAVTKEGSVVKIYLNGALGGQGTVTMVPSPTQLTIATTNLSNPFDGQIDEPAVYGVALSEQRILGHARAAHFAP